MYWGLEVEDGIRNFEANTWEAQKRSQTAPSAESWIWGLAFSVSGLGIIRVSEVGLGFRN